MSLLHRHTIYYSIMCDLKYRNTNLFAVLYPLLVLLSIENNNKRLNSATYLKLLSHKFIQIEYSHLELGSFHHNIYDCIRT
jgi:hypothetical protein